MRRNRMELQPKSVKEETRAMEAAGRRIFAAVNVVQDATLTAGRMKFIAGSMTRTGADRRPG